MILIVLNETRTDKQEVIDKLRRCGISFLSALQSKVNFYDKCGM